ncbi:MAG: hypothetical protein MZW92_28090 [Comamonadaceae bacterium]|nr:hypothetical protein [Comamonadaceae bacterium]
MSEVPMLDAPEARRVSAWERGPGWTGRRRRSLPPQVLDAGPPPAAGSGRGVRRGPPELRRSRDAGRAIAGCPAGQRRDGLATASGCSSIARRR